jgi:hypothetical protein
VTRGPGRRRDAAIAVGPCAARSAARGPLSAAAGENAVRLGVVAAAQAGHRQRKTGAPQETIEFHFVPRPFDYSKGDAQSAAAISARDIQDSLRRIRFPSRRAVKDELGNQVPPVVSLI